VCKKKFSKKVLQKMKKYFFNFLYLNGYFIVIHHITVFNLDYDTKKYQIKKIFFFKKSVENKKREKQ
jgi:hypothetical protein